MSEAVKQMSVSADVVAEQTEKAASGIGQVIMSMFSGMLSSYRKNRAISDLRQLDDRMLADIGIDRSEITSAVYGGIDRIRR
ncbi:MAG: DUF1127 domain-containing protein [Pseudomonadota bacterium]